MTDPTAEALGALNKSLREGRITLSEYSRRTKTITTAKAQQEEDRVHCRKVFDRFDKDGSGALDAKEFAALIYSLGGNMSKEESDAAFHALDKDLGGTIDFDEFYAWWSTPEVQGAKPSNLSAMRLALITNDIKERSAAAAQALNAALKRPAEAKQGGLQSFSLKIGAGQKFEGGTGLSVKYQLNETEAQAIAKEFSAAPTDFVFSVAFNVRPGKDAFELGVLSGKLRDLILLQKQVPFKRVQNDVKTVGDAVLFRVNLVLADVPAEAKEAVATVTKDVVRSLSLDLDLSENIGDKPAGDINVRLGLEAKVATGGDMVQQVLSALLKGNKVLKMPVQLLSKLEDAAIEIQTDTLRSLLAELLGAPAPFAGVTEAATQFSPLVLEGVPWADLPDTAVDTYKLISEGLLGLHSITAVANNTILRIEGRNVNFVPLLPSGAALDEHVAKAKAKKAAKKEQAKAQAAARLAARAKPAGKKPPAKVLAASDSGIDEEKPVAKKAIEVKKPAAAAEAKKPAAAKKPDSGSDSGTGSDEDKPVATKAAAAKKPAASEAKKPAAAEVKKPAAAKAKADSGSGSGSDDSGTGSDEDTTLSSMRLTAKLDYGFRQGSEPLRGSFVAGSDPELTKSLISASNGALSVRREFSSAFKNVLFLLYSRGAIDLVAKVDVSKVKAGEEYQPVIRMRMLTYGSVGSLKASFSDSKKPGRAAYALPKPPDSKWCEVPLGPPLRASHDGRISLDADTEVLAVQVSLASEEKQAKSGLYLDCLALYPVDRAAPAPPTIPGAKPAAPAAAPAAVPTAPTATTAPVSKPAALSANYDYLFKLVVTGDSGVGKSSLLLRFADNTFSESYISTIGVDFKIRTVTINAKTVKLQIWDTAGQERFRTITSAYYRGCSGVVICYDTTAADSFKSVSKWHKEATSYVPDTARLILCGTKTDLASARQVTPEAAKQLATTLGLQVLETSAKTNAGVQELFETFAKVIMESKKSP